MQLNLTQRFHLQVTYNWDPHKLFTLNVINTYYNVLSAQATIVIIKQHIVKFSRKMKLQDISNCVHQSLNQYYS